VDESGTEAEAVTSGTMHWLCLEPEVDLNRPFAYLVVDDITDTALFLGVVRNPELAY
jgi:serine protease inhibitor